MKPHFSDETKSQVVKDFAVALKNRHVRIKSFKPLVTYLSEPRVKTLCEIKQSGVTPIRDQYGIIMGYNRFFTESDAERYFEWLMAVVSGTEHENVSEDAIRQANDQLFRFIDALDLDMDKRSGAF